MPDSVLTSHTEIKSWLGITVTTDDTLLDSLASSILGRFKSYMGRDILSTAYTERYNGNGQMQMTLKQAPITAITSLTIDEVAIPAATTSQTYGYMFENSTLYLVSGNPGVSGLPGNAPARFGRGMRNVYVSYTAGWSTVPADIKHAATLQCAYEYQRQRNAIGMRSENQGQQQTNYITDPFLPGVKLVLDQYKRVATVI